MTKKKKIEKKTKQQLITDLRGHKKELQELRFRLSAAAQQKQVHVARPASQLPASPHNLLR